MTRPFSFVRLYSNAPRKPFPLTNLAIIRFVPRQLAPVASVTLPPSVAAKTHRPRSLRNLRSLCARSDSGSQQGGQAQRSAPYSRAERRRRKPARKSSLAQPLCRRHAHLRRLLTQGGVLIQRNPHADGHHTKRGGVTFGATSFALHGEISFVQSSIFSPLGTRLKA